MEKNKVNSKMDFVAIDFETAKFSRESACSVGLVKFINGEPAETYYSLIRPPRLYIRPDFTEIHGLTVNDVKDAPRFKDIWDSAIRPFVGDLPMAAHNAPFDMGVLQAVLKWYKMPIPEMPNFCTCNLARRTWPDFTSHALGMLAGNFGIIYNAHNALDDALTCGKLVLMSAEKFGSKNVKELLSAAGLKMSMLTP